MFFDLVLTGLDHGPVPGTEVWTKDSGTGPGGIANFAVALSRLGLSTSLSAAFGDDAFGRLCWETLERDEGVVACPAHGGSPAGPPRSPSRSPTTATARW